jgi:hypothetical protein
MEPKWAQLSHSLLTPWWPQGVRWWLCLAKALFTSAMISSWACPWREIPGQCSDLCRVVLTSVLVTNWGQAAHVQSDRNTTVYIGPACLPACLKQHPTTPSSGLLPKSGILAQWTQLSYHFSQKLSSPTGNRGMHAILPYSDRIIHVSPWRTYTNSNKPEVVLFPPSLLLSTGHRASCLILVTDWIGDISNVPWLISLCV